MAGAPYRHWRYDPSKPIPPTHRELWGFRTYVSYGSSGSSGQTQQIYRTKIKLGIENYNHMECLSWVLLHHPEWIIEESPIGIALSGLLKLASLGRVVTDHVRGINAG